MTSPCATVCLALALVTAAAAELQPQVVTTTFATEDVVIASRVVGIEQPEAVDCAPAIQAAIDEAAAAGGAVVFLPAGRYRLDSQVVIKEGVTLRGDWDARNPERVGDGTLLMVYHGRGQEDGPPAIILERGSGLREVAIWYPEQDAGAPVPYPWTLRCSETVSGDNYTVQNVTLVNPWQGFKVGPEGNELHTLRNVHGTPLKTGLSMDSTTDIGRLTYVRFSPRYWADCGLPGAPAAVPDARIGWVEGSVGIDIGRSDWEYLTDLSVQGFEVGLRFRQGARGTTNAVMHRCGVSGCGTALELARLNGVGLSATQCTFGGQQFGVRGLPSFDTALQLNDCRLDGAEALRLDGPGTATLQDCDLYGRELGLAAEAGWVNLLGGSCDSAAARRRQEPGLAAQLGAGVRGARLLGGRGRMAELVRDESRGDVQRGGGLALFAPLSLGLEGQGVPPPVEPKLFVVTDYSASPDAPDNAPAFAQALSAARAAGGGTVYVPAGQWRLGAQLTVPTGVELRGIFDVPHHTVSGGSVLLVTYGRGDEDGAPVLSLEPRSGVRGLTMWWPEQDVAAPAPYPWAIRGLGTGCWVVDTTLGNAWQGVDFWTHPSEGHVVSYLAGAVLRRGLFVSKGRGKVEDVQFNPHYALRLPRNLPRPAAQGDVGGKLIDWQRANLEGIIFGRCRFEEIRGTFLYAAYDGIGFRDDGGGATAQIINHGSDTCSRPAAIEQAEQLEFVNAQLVPYGPREVGGIVTGDGFTGRAAFYNSQLWAGTTTAVIGGRGDVLLQQLNTLTGPIVLRGGRCRLVNARFAGPLAAHVKVEAGVEQAEVIGCVGPGPFQVETAAPERTRLLANSASGRATSVTHGDRFALSTGWEPGEPQGPPDTVATPGGGLKTVSALTCRPTQGDAHSGQWALKLTGTADDPAYSYAYAVALREPVAVNEDTTLEYWIKPLNERGRQTFVDIVFADGSTLRDSPATITTGGHARGAGGTAQVGEWKRVEVPIGRWHAGKTVATVMFAYDSRSGGGPFEALVDDLRIDSPEARVPSAGLAAEPRGGRVPVGTRVSLHAPEGMAIRYTRDGSNPTADSPRYEGPIVLETEGLHELRFSVQAGDGTMGQRVVGELYEVGTGR